MEYVKPMTITMTCEHCHKDAHLRIGGAYLCAPCGFSFMAHKANRAVTNMADAMSEATAVLHEYDDVVTQLLTNGRQD